MSKILYLACNNLRLIFRKKSNIIVYIILPVVMISALMTITSSNSASAIFMGVVDRDHGRISQDMISFLERTGKFEITELAEESFEEAVSSGRVDFAFIIPQNFGQQIRKGRPEKLKIVSIKGGAATVFIEEYAAMYTENLLDIYSLSEGDAEIFNRLYSNQINGKAKLISSYVSDNELNKEAAQMSWGLFIILIMISCSTTATLVLKEKRERTYYRIISAPVSYREYIMANVLVNFLISIVQIISALLIIGMIVTFDSGIASWQIFIILSSFSTAAVAVGMLIMVFSDSTSTARMMITLIITPSCMLSGCFWPKTIMPKALQYAADFLPQSWVMDAITTIQGGGTFSEVGLNILIVLSFSTFFFLLAANKLKKSNNAENFI
ncbi:MAG: ABC transporter permease [Spirochaetales bacterium]|nr:ABC transporter permease [Spirochaetales bacterium]